MFLGRPWPGPGEPMWLDDDQDKVGAYLRLRREVCARCGTVDSDWIDQTTGRYRDDPPYEATLFRCHGCRELEEALEEVPSGQKGVRVALIPRPDDDEEEE